MKTFLTFGLLLMSYLGFSQDKIVTKNGMEFQVRIVGEDANSITYKVFGKEDGDPIVIPKKNLASFSYEPGTRPEKKNNTIVISTQDDYQTALRKVVNLLTDAGYGIHAIDKDLGIITTTPKAYKNGSTTLNIQVREGTNTEIIIRGSLDGTDLTISGVIVDGKANIEYRGMNNSPLMNAWNEMEGFAKSYTDGKLSYYTK